MPASPPLPPPPPATGITSLHDAAITPDTIIPAGLGDKLDLHLAVWASLTHASHPERAA